MSSGELTPHLLVLGDAPGDSGAWATLVSEVATVADLAPLVSVPPRRGGSRAQAVLAYAATTTEPVLVLPADPPFSTDVAQPRLRRALVPIDRSPGERRVLRWWIERAQAAGVEIEQVHVLDRTTRPAMWEGPGHHAEAWRAGLRLHHQVGDATLQVRSGDPAASIDSMAGRADLVILCWEGHASASRATVLRRVLEDARKPALLVRAIPTASRASPAGPPRSPETPVHLASGRHDREGPTPP